MFVVTEFFPVWRYPPATRVPCNLFTSGIGLNTEPRPEAERFSNSRQRPSRPSRSYNGATRCQIHFAPSAMNRIFAASEIAPSSCIYLVLFYGCESFHHPSRSPPVCLPESPRYPSPPVPAVVVPAARNGTTPWRSVGSTSPRPFVATAPAHPRSALSTQSSGPPGSSLPAATTKDFHRSNIG